MATDPHHRLLTAEEFLQIDFGPDVKAELDNGIIRMMGGGTAAHDRVQVNIIGFLRSALRGSGRRPSGSELGIHTREDSVRYHHMSEAHLGRYCREFDFRYNTRKDTDGERAALVLKGMEGKRLTYRRADNLAA